MTQRWPRRAYLAHWPAPAADKLDDVMSLSQKSSDDAADHLVFEQNLTTNQAHPPLVSPSSLTCSQEIVTDMHDEKAPQISEKFCRGHEAVGQSPLSGPLKPCLVMMRELEIAR